MVSVVGKDRLVLDLSCRVRDGKYWVVTDRWQNFTDTEVNAETLELLGSYCDEFLVHAADVEGKQEGIDLDLVRILADGAPVPTTYAGGAKSLKDMERIFEVGRGRVNLTIGSALDIFGGTIPYCVTVDMHRRLRGLQE